MFLAFPSQERSGNERELVKVYLMAVEDVQPGFVAMACKRFIQGQVERASLTWRPTPAELAVEARRLHAKAFEQQRQAAALLPPSSLTDPPDPTPEERQRCAEMWARVRPQIMGAVESSAMPRRRFRSETLVSHLAPPSQPAVDLSDFPDTGANRGELQAWGAREKASAV